MPVDKKDKENCEEMGTCEAIEALENRSEEEWTTAFIEHGILHFVEWMETAKPLQGQLTYIIYPLGYAAFFYLQRMNYRQGVDEDYYDNWESMDDDEEAGTNLWEMAQTVKTFGSATLLGLLGLVELVNLLVGLGELNLMLWGYGSMLLGLTDLTSFLMALFGLRKANQIAQDDDSSTAEETAADAVVASLGGDIKLNMLIDTIVGGVLYMEMTNWLAAQFMDYYEEEKNEEGEMAVEADEEELVML